MAESVSGLSVSSRSSRHPAAGGPHALGRLGAQPSHVRTGLGSVLGGGRGAPSYRAPSERVAAPGGAAGGGAHKLLEVTIHTAEVKYRKALINPIFTLSVSAGACSADQSRHQGLMVPWHAWGRQTWIHAAGWHLFCVKDAQTAWSQAEPVLTNGNKGSPSSHAHTPWEPRPIDPPPPPPLQLRDSLSRLVELPIDTHPGHYRPEKNTIHSAAIVRLTSALNTIPPGEC
jgi:hypothetical protein